MGNGTTLRIAYNADSNSMHGIGWNEFCEVMRQNISADSSNRAKILWPDAVEAVYAYDAGCIRNRKRYTKS